MTAHKNIPNETLVLHLAAQEALECRKLDDSEMRVPRRGQIYVEPRARNLVSLSRFSLSLVRERPERAAIGYEPLVARQGSRGGQIRA